MEEFWMFLKIVEAVLGIICIFDHVTGFLDESEPLPHQMFFCGTYFGFTVIAIIGCIGIHQGLRSSLFMEALVSSVATLFYFICSIFSMYHAEKDYHLMYLNDKEEGDHPYFDASKDQSIASLCAGLLYLLHAVFAIDAIIINEEDSSLSVEAKVTAKADIECHQPIRLYVFGKTIHELLMEEDWFRWIIGHELRYPELIKP